MNNDELSSVFEELISVFDNLKAEIIVTEVQKNTSNTIDFLVQNQSSFSRSYRRDIIDVAYLDDSNGIQLNLSRNGLYDSLPEGLFHGHKENEKHLSYRLKRKRYKEEEKEARRFFSPIESEFFNQRLHIEANERDILRNFYDLEDEFLIDFWKIDKNIPKAYALKLVKLLPYCFKISGDLELTRLSLENILEYSVKFTLKYQSKLGSETTEPLTLGVNLITQSKQTEILEPYLEVEIGPIATQDIDTICGNHGVQKFLEAFYSYFIPLELDVKTKYSVANKDGFVLNKNKSSSLGLTTRL